MKYNLDIIAISLLLICIGYIWYSYPSVRAPFFEEKPRQTYRSDEWERVEAEEWRRNAF